MTKTLEGMQETKNKELSFLETERDYELLKAELKRTSRGFMKLQEFKEKLYAKHEHSR